MPLLSVIIVSYNVRSYLEKLLHSAGEALEQIPSEIIVVDNASDDESARMVQETFPDTVLMRNDDNVGFARANNRALKRAMGDFIVLLNPDTVVNNETFASLLEAFEHFPEAGMVGGKVLNEDGSLQIGCRRSFPTPWVSFTRLIGLSKVFPGSRIFARYNLTYLDPDTGYALDAVSGSFMAVRKPVLEDVGYLDERFFLYGEDLDWCYRIRQSGWKIVYYPKASILHYKGRSSQENNWEHCKHFYDAMLLFAEKHFKSYNFLTPLWLIKSAILLLSGAALIRCRIKNLLSTG